MAGAMGTSGPDSVSPLDLGGWLRQFWLPILLAFVVFMGIVGSVVYFMGCGNSADEERMMDRAEEMLDKG